MAKLDTKGNFLWVVPCGAPAGYDIAVDSSGTSNIVGQFKGTTTFGKHSLTASSATTFVARLSNAGTFLWATAAPGLTRNSIALDGSGNTYLQGPGKLARLDNNGKLLWTKTLCSFTGTTPYGRAVALDSAGNAYISGQYWKSATCGATVLGSSGGVYIVKASPAGKLVWATGARAVSSGSGFDSCDLTTFGGSVVATGFYWQNAVFGSKPVSHPGGGDQLYVWKLYSP